MNFLLQSAKPVWSNFFNGCLCWIQILFKETQAYKQCTATEGPKACQHSPCCRGTWSWGLERPWNCHKPARGRSETWNIIRWEIEWKIVNYFSSNVQISEHPRWEYSDEKTTFVVASVSSQTQFFIGGHSRSFHTYSIGCPHSWQACFW